MFVLNAILATVKGDEFYVFSIDKEFGLFGFLNPEIAVEAFIFAGFFATVCGAGGYIACLLFFDPLVVSSSLLIEPFAA